MATKKTSKPETIQEARIITNSEIQGFKKQKQAKNALGASRRILQERIAEVEGIDLSDFHSMYEDDGAVDEIDPDSLTVLKEIAEVLRGHCSAAEVEFFNSNEGVEHEPYNSHSEIKHGVTLTWLHHRARQLDKIIEKQM